MNRKGHCILMQFLQNARVTIEEIRSECRAVQCNDGQDEVVFCLGLIIYSALNPINEADLDDT